MATVVWRDAMLWVNGVDLSNDVRELNLNFASESLDDTAMGDDTRSHKGGLFDWSIGLTFHQDFLAAQVDATLWPLVGTTTCVEIRPRNSCTTVNNPSFYGIGTLMNYTPMTGAVGSLLDVPATIQSAGSLTRSVAAS